MTTADDVLGRLALALDDLLARASPADVEALRALVPTGLLDQADAATAEVRGLLDRVTATGDLADRFDLPSGDHPSWVRLGLTTTLASWCTGMAATCLHGPHPSRPQPVHAAAWKPNLVACGECIHLLALPRNSDADRRCDGCGTVTAGPDIDGGIHQCMATVGALTYYFGACEGCRYWTPDQKRVTS